MSQEKKSIRINIEAKFGDDFQHKTALKGLKALIGEWAKFFHGKHKGNDIEYSILDNEE